MAGHSAWKNIKHKKAAADARRGKVWSKCARAIIVAAKTGGGDPASNLALRYAIDDARAANMPRDTIDKAIKKGTGELAAESYESATYEGYGPSGVAVMIEILTDNRHRTAPEVKRILERAGGNLGGPGSVGYMFQPRGMILIAKATAGEERVMDAALDAGALDVTEEGETWRVVTEPGDLARVRDALDKGGLAIESAELTREPTMTVALSGEDARRVVALMEELEDHDDVQRVHANFEIPDAELAAMQG
jgi:YebC/PmpR family DNA-binding regulatory protein